VCEVRWISMNRLALPQYVRCTAARHGKNPSGGPSREQSLFFHPHLLPALPGFPPSQGFRAQPTCITKSGSSVLGHPLTSTLPSFLRTLLQMCSLVCGVMGASSCAEASMKRRTTSRCMPSAPAVHSLMEEVGGGGV
jgi:hypothetical protein